LYSKTFINRHLGVSPI